MTLETYLQPFARFGVHLGLERIESLLAALGNPHQKTPFIHVAGTNGKGSVCAYLSSVLSHGGYRVGRYTSPHLIDWCERIQGPDQLITPAELSDLLKHIHSLTQHWPESQLPTQFEVLTAAAWLYFKHQRVEVAVMEVGLGGRLDATNVTNGDDRPLVSVITSIGWDHWQHLGNTLAAIAGEKAGILKPHCPAVIGPLPPEAATVVHAKVQTLACPAIWVEPANPLPNGWMQWGTHTYAPSLPGAVQRTNSAVAIATIEALQRQGWSISETAIQTGMAQTIWPGRMQWVQWQGLSLLLDGAHNPPAAQALREFVDEWLTFHRAPVTSAITGNETGVVTGTFAETFTGSGTKNKTETVTWIVGMLATKAHLEILSALLREGDRLHLVPVSDHYSAHPEDLKHLVLSHCSPLDQCHTHPTLDSALATVKADHSLAQGKSIPEQPLTVLCGSLYLVGQFFLLQQVNGSPT